MALGFSNPPPAMAARGASLPFMGRNPVRAAFPARDPPVVVGLAPSQVARGRILKAARLGEAIPSGWGLDAKGRSTTDPAEAINGSLAPLGGAKGFALATMVEALTGVLAGAAVGPQVGGTYLNSDKDSDVGHCFIAIDAEAIAPGFAGRRTGLAAAIRSLDAMEGGQAR